MDIRVPHIAEGVESGTVVSILVKEGDQVRKDQDLLELETKKAVAPIPSPQSGKVAKILVKPGDEVAVGQAIVSLIESSNGGASAAEPAGKEPAKDHRPPAAEPLSEQRSFKPEPARAASADYRYESKSGMPPPASPTIRKMARDLGIDLTRVQGSEHGGRIALSDVRRYIERLQQAAFPKAPSGAPAPSAKPPAPSVDFSKWGPVKKQPMSPIRRAIAEKMMESKNSVADVTQFDEADITGMLELRKKYVAAYEKKGTKLTLTGMILKALVPVLKAHPVFNCSLDEAAQTIVFKEYVHFGIAVDTEAGLLVPVLRDAEKKSVLELSKALVELAEKARTRKVTIDDLQGGSFTISNQGGIGGTHFTPIVNRPEVAILGLGQGQTKPAAVGGKVAIRTALPLCLSYDHRVIDGANAARFIKDLRDRLENFDEKELKI